MAELQYTPVTLWQDFDKADVETEVNVLRVKRSGYLATRPLYFTGSPKGLQIFARASDRPPKTRVYAEFCRLAKKTPDNSMPAVLVINEPGTKIDAPLMRKLAKEGYAVLSLDLDGDEGPDKLTSTIYSPETPYARYFRAENSGFAFKDAKFSCWYEWAAIAMRAITVLSSFKEVAPDKIGVMAVGRACDIAAAVAYKDERVKRVCVLFGNPSACTYKDENMQKQYTAALSVRAYVQHIKCPVLYMGATNESAFDITEACETFSRLAPQTGSSLSLSERLDHEIGYMQAGNLKAWFGGMEKELPPPVRPSMTIKTSENKLYCSVTINPGDAAVAVKAFVSYGNACNKYRNWAEIQMQQSGEYEYVGTIKPFEGLTVYSFAQVTYECGLNLSTRIVNKNTADLNIPLARPDRRRLIYSTERTTGSFTTINGDLTFHRIPNVFMREGPLGLAGVSNNVGYLASYKIGSELHKGEEGETLLIDMACGKAADVEIVIRDTEGAEYAFTVHLKPGSWQKVAAEAKMFKNAGNIPLPRFKRAALLYFRSAAHILISSMLWM